MRINQEWRSRDPGYEAWLARPVRAGVRYSAGMHASASTPAPQIYDISPPLTPSLAVWPGDTPLSREVLCEISRGDTVTLSTMRSTVHLGAHADGPNHYGNGAPAIDTRPLNVYLGCCQVMHVRATPGQRIRIADLPTTIDAERLLVASGTFPDPNEWTEEFAALEPALVDHCHAQGVRLIGIDTPSVDLFSDKQLLAHSRFLAHDMAILEGLMLSDVPPGMYELIALPLKLVGFDASPVRAVLRALS